MRENPFLAESTLPLRYPPFDRIRDEDYAPAFEAGMAEQLREIGGILGSGEPTFDNTVAAIERSGRTLTRTAQVFYNLNGADTNPRMQEVEQQMAPRLAAHRDAIYLNAPLFARFESLYRRADQLGLDEESIRLLERYRRDFVRSGVALPEGEKVQLRALNTELATLAAQFNQAILKERNASAVLVDTREELAGLSEGAISAAADQAAASGHPGKFLIALGNTTGQEPLASLENRAVRRRILEASLARGSRGGEFDTRALAVRIARLRAERAALLGYATHAAYQDETASAGSVEAVEAMLGQLVTPATAAARREAALIQEEIDRSGGGFRLEAWDWAYYREKVRSRRFAFDAGQLRPYLELNRVLKDGVFFAATQLFGIRFRERHDLPAYRPDVRVFDVLEEDGTLLALFVGDFYARDSKQGGAWMNSYVSQSRLLGDRPVVGNHLNVPRPPDGQPTLLTLDEVITLFHEFGHALHGIFSQVAYPFFSGTRVPRDFVEFPSQNYEMWLSWPEVVRNYARHHLTGEPMPEELFERTLSARTFNQGFATLEYLKATLLDQAWHTLSADAVPEDVGAFETEVFLRSGVDFPPVPPRYRSTYFSHVFPGGYSAGYYSYIWADIMVADSVEWIRENGGLSRQTGDRLRSSLLSRGGTEEASALYRRFSGRDPEIGALLRQRGLVD